MAAPIQRREAAMRTQPLQRAPRKRQSYQTSRKQARAQGGEGEREVPEWEIKLGKTIFYLTVALSLWFFYWFAGIQCPC